MSRKPLPRRPHLVLLGLLMSLFLGLTVAAPAASASERAHAGHATSSGTSENRLDAAAARAVLPAAKNVKSLSIDDTAGVLSEPRLKKALDGVKFHKPTKVAIYTREGDYSDDINTKTLDYAKKVHPEWISDDPEDYGDYWADGLFIVTLSVETGNHGQVGTYFGEDRALKQAKMEKTHQAGTDNFRQGRWTDGVADVVKEGAKLIERPWYLNPALYLWTLGLLAVVGIGVAVWLSIRSKRRQEFDSHMATGVAHVAQVATDLDTTELSARTLPTDSPHAADMERRFEDFIQQFRKAFTEQQELEAVDPKHRHQDTYVRRAKAFSDTAADLDFTDDAIIQAAALYTRSATWQDAWRAQTAPLLEDLDRLDSVSGSAPVDLRSVDATLASFREEARAKVESVSSDLEAQRITVDQALDALSDLRSQLTKQLERFSEAQIAKYAKSASEERLMREQMSSARYGQRRSGTGSILDVSGPANHFWRVAAYQMGYTAGHSRVESARSAASSSSRSGGFSGGYSGGGSFSGSGGSSRF
ncbi:DUF5129 domain-containing protein [Galactobacter sp.]|uniref:DUF5129 domain-containing protein n=1 Tax=Galactobacter sp. TaxID=2676125 RepID=UPI0025B86202|nr:DUF5129 domain-containing protein [Galactobacter sp.]